MKLRRTSIRVKRKRSNFLKTSTSTREERTKRKTKAKRKKRMMVKKRYRSFLFTQKSITSHISLSEGERRC